MTDTAVYVITGVLAVIAAILFLRTSSSGRSGSLTQQKQAEVKRKRAALIAKRKAEAKAREDAAPFED